MSFAQLKKNRTSSFDKLNKQIQEMSKGGYSNNEDEWKLTVNSDGVGSAIIRFLPAPENEEFPFVRVWDHGFKGPGGWYIEKSRTTLPGGEADPVSEMNSELWATGIESNKEIVRSRKRRLKYWMNIYVVKDAANPENEGKVFKYSAPVKIFEMINNAMHPEFDDTDPVNPYDFWEGANFRIKAKNGDGGWRTYAPSSFDAPSKMTKPDGTEMTDEEMEAVWKSQHSLSDIVDPKNFKSYEELKAKLNKVLKISETLPQESAPEIEHEIESMSGGETEPDFPEDDEEDDALSVFKALASD